MSEATIQADLSRELLKLTAHFSAGDVVIEDYSVLDGSSAAAPFAIIESSDDFAQVGVETQWSLTWQVSFTLLVRFIDWDTSRLAMRDLRQAVIDALTDTTHYSASSVTLAWGLRGIASGSGISEVYDRYNENSAESLPVYLSQRIILEVEETSEA
jgi:hypothetical protein